MATPLQPTLPGEVRFTDAEKNFIEDSPVDLFPENQDSNFGLLRKLWTDRIQELIEQQNTIYNERFTATSDVFLDMWEKDVGLPTSRVVDRTVAQRRLDVMTRLFKGPFSTTIRNQIIANAISSTFGTVPAFGPTGIALSSGGLPLFAEAADVSTLFTVRDNTPAGRNMIPNPSFETDISGWSNDGTFTGVSRVTDHAKWGLASISGLAANTSPYFYYATGLSAGQNAFYTASAWLRVPVRNVLVAVSLQFLNSSSAVISTAASPLFPLLTTDGWKRFEFTALAPVGTNFIRPIYQVYNALTGDQVWLDGAQAEATWIVARGKNLVMSGTHFDSTSDLAGWSLGGSVTMAQDTSVVHDGAGSALVNFISSSASITNGNIPIKPGPAGRTFTLSMWVYATGSAIGKPLRIGMNASGGPSPDEAVGITDKPFLQNGWQKMTVTGTLANESRTLLIIYALPLGVAFPINIDSVQVEESPVATSFAYPQLAADFIDPQKPTFYYEVRIKNTITPDMVSLLRELHRITPASMAFDVLQVADV
jgi:hypothetical protein